MASDTEAATGSKKMLWAGYITSTLPALMLLMSGVMKLVKPEEVVKGFAALGWSDSLALPLGIVELVCVVLYVIPRTAVLGAILLTGYLGGATATHVRIGDPFIGPVIFGVLVWLGLYLREARLRALIPLPSFLPILGGAAAAGFCVAVLRLFASEGDGTGFSSSELKILPWVIFFIVSFAIRSASQSAPPENGQTKSIDSKSGEAEK